MKKNPYQKIRRGRGNAITGCPTPLVHIVQFAYPLTADYSFITFFTATSPAAFTIRTK